MSIIEGYLLVVATLCASLWLASWARLNLLVFLLTGSAITVTLFLLEHVLIQQSVSEWHNTLSEFHSVMAVWLCLESWFLSQSKKIYSLINISGLLACIYLQMQLYQSGLIALSFSFQTACYAVAVLLFAVLLRAVCAEASSRKGVMLFLTAAIWMISWVSVSHWPQSSEVFGEQYYWDFIKLLAVLAAGVVAVLVIARCSHLYHLRHKNLRERS